MEDIYLFFGLMCYTLPEIFDINIDGVHRDFGDYTDGEGCGNTCRFQNRQLFPINCGYNPAINTNVYKSIGT